MNQVSQITSVVKHAAHDAGFELAGIAPVRDFDELKYFPDWIAAGHAGEMKYMEARDGADNSSALPFGPAHRWARSVNRLRD